MLPLNSLHVGTRMDRHACFLNYPRTSPRTSSTSLKAAASLCTPSERVWNLLTTPTPSHLPLPPPSPTTTPSPPPTTTTTTTPTTTPSHSTPDVGGGCGVGQGAALCGAGGEGKRRRHSSSTAADGMLEMLVLLVVMHLKMCSFWSTTGT